MDFQAYVPYIPWFLKKYKQKLSGIACNEIQCRTNWINLAASSFCGFNIVLIWKLLFIVHE